MANTLDRIASIVRRLNRGGLLIVLLAVLPAAAHAAMYYVSPGGSDSNSGTSPASPWRTIEKANSTVRAGDAVRVAAGSYGRIQPVNGGAAGSRITYIGDMVNPGAVAVSGITINVPYVTVKGFSTGATLALNYPARYDSVAYCRFGGATFYGVKYSMVARNVISGGISFTYDGGQANGGISNCERDTLRGNVITTSSISPNHHFKVRGNAQYCLVDSNRVSGVFTSSTVDGIGRLIYNGNHFTFRDNSWTYEATAPVGVGQWRAFSMRDSANGHVFERDTVLMGLNSPYAIAGVMGSSGTYGNVRNNTWDGCVYRTNSYIYNEDQLNGVTIRNSVFAGKGNDATVLFYDVLRNCTIDHNTFYSDGEQAFRVDIPFPSGSGTRITSNIFYSKSAQAASGGGGVILYANASGFTANNNLYFSPTSTNGSRSITWCCFTGSAPGTGQPWYNTSGQDGQSAHGSPMFMDSTSYATLDAHLRSNSRAIGRGAGGTDAGAYPFGSGGPDTTPPGTVADLNSSMVSDQVIVLAWTAPGGNGSTGQASVYDLRWSLAPISAASFASATPVAVQPVPLLAGQAQSYVMSGLTPGTTYYFALKAQDAAGNWSAMSNAPAIATTATDQATPASVRDLSTQP